MHYRRESAIGETIIAADELTCGSQEDGWIVIVYHLVDLVIDQLSLLQIRRPSAQLQHRGLLSLSGQGTGLGEARVHGAARDRRKASAASLL